MKSMNKCDKDHTEWYGCVSVQAMWRHDFTVERVELDFAVCTNLLQILLTNTRQLPLSLQRLDKFYVSWRTNVSVYV